MIPFKTIGTKKDGALFRYRAKHLNGKWRKGLIFAGDMHAAVVLLKAQNSLIGYQLDCESIRTLR